MRIEARLNRLAAARQAIADRKVEAILRDLHQWSDEDVTAALKVAMQQCDPRFVNNPQEVERLFLPENEHELMEFLRAERRAELWPERGRR